MKRLGIIIIGFVIFFIVVRSCSSSSEMSNTNITVASYASDGLDLKALAAIVKDVKSAEELEKKLNSKEGINNLDLNEDNVVDYLKVTEYGGNEGSYGFSITAEPEKGEVQEIATIEISKKGEKGEIDVRGNRHIYGDNHGYHSSHFWRNMFIFSYLTNGFGRWHSPYYWGHYPRYYHSYRPVAYSSYTRRAKNYHKNSNITRSKKSRSSSAIASKNPNYKKTASKGIKSSLKNPTRTQRQFQKRQSSKRVRSGGFGRNTRKTSSIRGRSHSGSSFGFGK